MAKLDKKTQSAAKPLKRNDLIASKEKTKMFHKYKKMIRKSDMGLKTNLTYKNEIKKPTSSTTSKSSSYKTANQRAQLLFEEKQKEKQKEKEQLEKIENEKREAIQNYKNVKKDKFKKLCKKTKNGQILMGKQMDTLLNKIQNNLKK
jgi:predicted transposase YbfD/YdcC